MTKLNISLIKQAVLAKQANRRQATSSTKTRGEVSGGGRKPFRQKGTGSARAGSRRSPVWVGGGIVFGPVKERNFKQKLPKKMAKQAIVQALDLFNKDGNIKIADKLELKEPKTKMALDLLAKNGVEKNRILIITNDIQPELVLGARNLPNIKVVVNKDLSILHLVEAEEVLMDKASAESRGLIKKEASKAADQSSTKKTPTKAAAKKTAK